MTVAAAPSPWELAEAEADRWVAAAARAAAEGIRVMQVEPCGSWIATSGTEPGKAYRLDVTGGVCHGCACMGHDFTKVCKHRAAWHVQAGQLVATARPVPVQRLMEIPCSCCVGTGAAWSEHFMERRPCWRCDGSGTLDAAA